MPQSSHRLARFLVFPASLRAGSLNYRLAFLTANLVEALGGEVDFGSMHEFDAPSYDQDVAELAGFPPGPTELARRLAASDAFVISSPEYNFSMPGGLKNAIDWVSRMRPQPFYERHALLMSASPSPVGGNRGLWALRVPLEHLGARLYPDMFALARADRAFDRAGRLVDPTLRRWFEGMVAGFIDWVEGCGEHPHARGEWREFLGEGRATPA
ncbi:NAD(P)H-dependent oxidoreductase [Longimycelium tulufanense]|uniref:NAD(P)H-dependent oxidoreductase n=1 Tax=Longimycelium tulufanense TaxID=907463 RepID=A0A8J3CET7_9PSEU|nr:NAD(P)H-dependent oxidoreductase [Longimycelium tulufanense]GGM68704.1 NAD(P)H-dependent oxidoreductase [Longimycelium tulufanense]